MKVTGNGWTMLHGDCLSMMRGVGTVDHIICDPPYDSDAHTKARRSLKDATQKKGARNTGEVRRIDAPIEIAFPPLTEVERDEVSSLMTQRVSRWVLAFCQLETIGAWRSSFERAGLSWRRAGVWRKPNGAPQFTGDRPGQGAEGIAIAHANGKSRWNGGGRHSVFDCPLEHNTGERGRNEHPTQKPVALMLELVSLFTDPGELILDPYAGSGTTGVAALRLGRRFVGIERKQEYFDLACERLRAEERGQTLTAYRSGQQTLLGEVGT